MYTTPAQGRGTSPWYHIDMRISFTTLISNITDKNGYGTAGLGVVESLQALGHEVNFQDAEAPIELAFNQPIYDTFGHTPGQHKIIYTPWESTALPDGWLEKFNEADEVWTTSNVIKDWYHQAGVEKDIYVYHHGINPLWTGARRRHRRGKKFRFLYVGSPAPRKGGQMVYDAFIDLFGSDPDYHLTIKSYGRTEIRHKVRGEPIGPAGMFSPNITIMEETVSTDALLGIFESHDAVVYPSWGEGFGLIPFQAMAAGIPTICTGAWADYRDLLVPQLVVESELAPSPWPRMHPGKMFRPDVQSLKDSMRWVVDNYDLAAGHAFRNSYKLEKDYDWLKLTEEAFKKFL